MADMEKKLPKGYARYYVSTKTGIAMEFKCWLQVICQKYFGYELCMVPYTSWDRVVAKFNEFLEEGIFRATTRAEMENPDVMEQLSKEG